MKYGWKESVVMKLPTAFTDKFLPLVAYTERIGNEIGSTATALLIIHNDAIVTEHYFGYHSHLPDAKRVQESSQFYSASVRKSYIGFVIANLVFNGYIECIDDPVTKYLPHLNQEVAAGTNIRHLLTHTHGLGMDPNGQWYRRFQEGTSWEYRNENIDLLTSIAESTSGRTVAEILEETVFHPLHFQETGWHTKPTETLVPCIKDPHAELYYRLYDTASGEQDNMYISPLELAYWGYLHLQKGKIDGKQIVPAELIDWTTSIQSPSLSEPGYPKNGYLWFIQDEPMPHIEIGEMVPKGSYQILGFTGVYLLVVPECNALVVRAYNKMGTPPDYHYVKDIQTFGNIFMQCLQ
jgi:CubicO group peptidase (beta-lactamase class C family)